MSALFETVIASDDPHMRWRVLTDGLAQLGLDQINYSFLDLATHGRLEARGEPAMSTMRRDWIERYMERRYDMADDVVEHVRAGHFAPAFFRYEEPHRFVLPVMANECREAGLRSGLLIPLCGDAGSVTPTAGVMFGSSLSERETQQILRERAPALVALAHVFHTGMVGELRRMRAGVKPLSPREKDCLQLAARGLRTAAIADRLALADGTVELHFANARRKLGAKTLTEAVARALQFHQIELE